MSLFLKWCQVDSGDVDLSVTGCHYKLKVSNFPKSFSTFMWLQKLVIFCTKKNMLRIIKNINSTEKRLKGSTDHINPSTRWYKDVCLIK